MVVMNCLRYLTESCFKHNIRQLVHFAHVEKETIDLQLNQDKMVIVVTNNIGIIKNKVIQLKAVKYKCKFNTCTQVNVSAEI